MHPDDVSKGRYSNAKTLSPYKCGLIETQGLHQYLVDGSLVMTKAFRIVMLDVPSPTILGESVELTCSYELDNEQLYSVKWYKNDVEFYRYVPNDWPPGQFLPLPGIRVDVSTKF
ncbi:UNVERIFIED_CONTAM: hypothetical protein NCL1_15819 [Trichonephila clavipes]